MPEQGDIGRWSVDTLHEHIKAIMDEREKRHEQVLLAQKEAVESALSSAQRAVDKAEGIAEKWRLNANEWRAAMTDKDAHFLTKEVARGYFVTGLMAAGVMIGVVELVVRVLFRHIP